MGCEAQVSHLGNCVGSDAIVRRRQQFSVLDLDLMDLN